MLIRSNHFDANRSLQSSGYGGAVLILNNSNGALEGNQFSNNVSEYYGGALALKQSSLRIFRNLFVGNQANRQGGGLYVDAFKINTQQVNQNDMYLNYCNLYASAAAHY